MSTKHILGLDLGTNSIGWAVVKSNDTETQQCVLSGIVDAGSRIIPMDAAMQSDFAKGNTISQTKDRHNIEVQDVCVSVICCVVNVYIVFYCRWVSCLCIMPIR